MSRQREDYWQLNKEDGYVVGGALLVIIIFFILAWLLADGLATTECRNLGFIDGDVKIIHNNLRILCESAPDKFLLDQLIQ